MGQLKLLLVEDGSDDADLLTFAFRKERPGWAVQRVWDGQTAIDYLCGKGEYANRQHYPLPDVVIFDIALPRLSGLELLQWRNTTPFLKTPFLVWTGRPDLAKKALELGATAAQSKQLPYADMIKVIQQLAPAPGGPRLSPIPPQQFRA